MATTTSKYGFIKPQLSDAANIEATNGNWDKIETEFTNVNDQITNVSKVVTNNNTSMLEITNNLNNTINNKTETLQPKIKFGTSKPSGGNHGDVYIQLIEV